MTLTSFHIYNEWAMSRPTGPAIAPLSLSAPPLRKTPRAPRANPPDTTPATNLDNPLLRPHQPVSDLYSPLSIMFQLLSHSNPSITHDCSFGFRPKAPFSYRFGPDCIHGSNTSFHIKNSSFLGDSFPF